MLPKPYRFHSRGGVRFTYRHGTTVRHPKISLTSAQNSRGKQRFAVVVSKKVSKSAVTRNRIRRRTYEAIRTQLPHLTTPHDHIFTIYTREIETLPFEQLQTIIRDLLSQTDRKSP